MNYISKHFVADNYDQLVLNREDWPELVWQALLKIYGLKDSERIVVSEYKLEAWTEQK